MTSPYPRPAPLRTRAGAWGALAVALGAASLLGCPPSEVPGVIVSPCQVVPPNTLSEAQRAAARANIDAAYAAFKGSAGGANDARSKIDATFAVVSDNQVTCAMLLRTVTCAVDHGDNTVALGFKDVIQQACTAQVPPCGHAGQACCSGGAGCDSISLCSSGTCVACGDVGQPCCASGCRSGACQNRVCSCPPPNGPPAIETQVFFQDTRDFSGGFFGVSEDYVVGGSCHQGWTRTEKEALKVDGNGATMAYDWLSSDPADCRMKFHVGAPVAGRVKVALTIKEQRPKPPPPRPQGC